MQSSMMLHGFHPRHPDFQPYLAYCSRQYKQIGHNSLTANLCTRHDWQAWRAAISGEACVVLVVVSFGPCFNPQDCETSYEIPTSLTCSVFIMWDSYL